ncbi:MAG TPA: hypothetical protein VI815_02880 [Candidatus Nanoarchaeia archaeon]|nr:hypothetical protein [Candidatus Nanoarchaeia archaeon]
MSQQRSINTFRFGALKNQPDDISTIKLKPVNIEELFATHNLSKLHLYLDGNDYEMDIENYLRIGNMNRDSDVDLEKKAEEISAIRYTMTASEADLAELIEELIDEMESAKAFKMNQLASTFTKPTDKMIYNQFIMTEEGKTFLKQKKLIGNYKNSLHRIKGLQFILAERVKILEGMLDRRYFTKKGKGKDGSI